MKTLNTVIHIASILPTRHPQTDRQAANRSNCPLNAAVRMILNVLLVIIVPMSAAQAEPGWIEQQAEPVSPEAHALYLEQRTEELAERSPAVQPFESRAMQRTFGTEGLTESGTVASAMTVADIYTQTAEALANDPVRIYQFVRNHFKYEPYYGALKGPYLTLLDRSGNDFDQAALLVELLRAAGIAANYQYGRMTIPHASAIGMDTAHWLGAEANAGVIGNIIASGGIPIANNYTDRIVLDRIWVVTTINGTAYALDPAFKPSEKTAGIDLAAAMGYNPTNLLNAAGGTLGTNSIENLNQNEVESELDDLTEQLLTTLKQSHPNAKVSEILGGMTIIADTSTTLPAALPFSATPTEPQWTEIPAVYLHTVRLQHGGIDVTLDIPEIAGKKLSIAYTGDTMPIDPPPAEATDFGTVSSSQTAERVWNYTNSNNVTVTYTASLSGSNAFSFVQGQGTRNVAPGSSTQTRIRFSAAGQTRGRKNATLTIIQSAPGFTPFTQNIVLTGIVETTPTAQIYLDDQLLLDEGTPTGDLNALILSVDHPYAANNGKYQDQDNVKFPVKRSGTYVLASGFGGDRHSILSAERQRRLDRLLLDGVAEDSREVITETLNIIGQSWYKQTQLDAEMLAAIGGKRLIRHHRFGIVGQEAGYFVDIKAQVQSTPASTVASGSDGSFAAGNFIASAMEHSVLEQLQGDNNPAMSTIKIFHLHNQTGGKFYLATPGNYAAIKGQLTGYDTNTLNDIQAAINNQARVILPQSGQVALNDWTGAGYVDYRVSGTQRSIGMIIGGGLHGGFASLEGNVNAITQSSLSRPAYTPSANIATPKGVDPVDLGSGAYLNAGTDLALGGNGPRGLRFGRSYNSRQVNANSAFMAPGWSHSYAIELKRFSDNDAALGLRTPQDAAALIVAAYVARDLLTDTQPDLENWITAALVAQWATDQLLDNAVAVNLGDRVLSYRQQPDGSYTPPPSVTTELIQNPNGTFKLEGRFGTVLTFNTDNRIQSLTDIDGNALSFTYSNGRLSQVEDAYHRTLTLTYTGDWLTQVSDNQGRSVHYDYTGDNLTGYRDAENKLWQYGYDDHHQILTVTDPVGVTIVDNVYDASGKVIWQTAPRDNHTTAVYTLHYTGLSSSEEDPLGHRTTYTYDFAGRTVAVENALGERSTVDYDGQGQVIKQTDPLGRISRHSYDSHNNLRVSWNPLDEPTEFQYDGQHRLTRVIDALGHGAEIDYDAKHRPIRFRNGETDASTGRRIQTLRRYYANGLLQLEADARYTRTDYVYDAYGWLDTQKTGAHPVVDTDYNAIGQLTRLADQNGTVTTFDYYDQRGLLTEQTDPLGKKRFTTYDDAGRVQSQTDRNGNVTSLAYTPTSQLKSITYQNGSQVEFNYDSRDNPVTMTDPSGTTTNSFDELNRLTGHTDPNGFTVAYQYDPAGNLQTLTYPGTNRTVTYGYDDANRLKTVKIDWLSGSPTTTYHYDGAGRMEQADLFNGSVTNYTLDKADRLTGIQHSTYGQTLADYQYTLDNNGNRIKAVVEEPIKPEALINRSQGYTYNAQKNRLLATQLNGTDQATFNYDHEGRLFRIFPHGERPTSFTFDHAHRLIRHGNEQYVYDGVGNRIRATRSGIATKYIVDAAGNLLAEANDSNQITRYYIHGQGLLGFVNASTNQLYTYLFDGTGHTVAITDQNRQTVNTYAYDPYGRLMAQTETKPQPFKYVGQFGVFSEEDNLYYMRARYYDADIGRFISEDPIGFEGGLNLYAYVGGNPIIFVDPSGFERIGISQAQILQFQQDAFDIAIGFALPVNTVGGLFKEITKSSLKRVKRLVKELSDNSRQNNGLSQDKTDQLRRIVEKAGGKLRNDGVSGVKGSSAGKPHVQTEGLGKSIDSRHIEPVIN
ncbi:RHS repeat-associated core domain-containing protein [Methylotuvimicrobium sp.]|uniref:RHS repeat-associated core domain-containing protein n=1 Tax=Methylotuvimicrobium sp. TaxID=2822413 RepID=UPI003D649816